MKIPFRFAAKWIKTVDQPNYVKMEWSELENTIQALAQEADRRRGNRGC